MADTLRGVLIDDWWAKAKARGPLDLTPENGWRAQIVEVPIIRLYCTSGGWTGSQVEWQPWAPCLAILIRPWSLIVTVQSESDS